MQLRSCETTDRAATRMAELQGSIARYADVVLPPPDHQRVARVAPVGQLDDLGHEERPRQQDFEGARTCVPLPLAYIRDRRSFVRAESIKGHAAIRWRIAQKQRRAMVLVQHFCSSLEHGRPCTTPTMVLVRRRLQRAGRRILVIREHLHSSIVSTCLWGMGSLDDVSPVASARSYFYDGTQTP